MQKITKITTTSILKELVHMLLSSIKLILKFSFSIFNMFIPISKTSDKDSLQSLCVHCYEGPFCDCCSRLNEDQNLSVVFDSIECKVCSNWWLTLVLYVIAGPLLFTCYILLDLHIFYAHLANYDVIVSYH